MLGVSWCCWAGVLVVGWAALAEVEESDSVVEKEVFLRSTREVSKVWFMEFGGVILGVWLWGVRRVGGLEVAEIGK